MDPRVEAAALATGLFLLLAMAFVSGVSCGISLCILQDEGALRQTR